MSGNQTPADVDIENENENENDNDNGADLETEFESLNIEDHERKVLEEKAIIQSGDDDELERFRREWRAEVTTRRKVDVGGVRSKEEVKTDKAQADEIPPVASTSTFKELTPKSPRRHEPNGTNRTNRVNGTYGTDGKNGLVQSPNTTRTAGRDRSQSPTNVKAPSGLASSRPEAGPSRPKTQASAVQLYAQAVENEQAGQLNEALHLYRRAFKIDDNVDRVYQKSLPKHVPDELQDDLTPTSTDIVSASVPKDEPYSFQRHLQFQPDYQKTQPPSTTTENANNASIRKRSPLTLLFDKASKSIDEATFEPEDEDKPFPLALLPAELLEPIFNNLDVASLERFALTCWRARYLTSRAEIWKKRVTNIYRHPMIPNPQKDQTTGSGTDDRTNVTTVAAAAAAALDLARRHDMEWRTTFLEEQRVRMDGCYISVCHYLRPGAGDEWVAVTHMITYHRFLRFYPDGTVISFLTTDHPSNVVPLLRPSLRSKGLHFGKWHLEPSRSKCIITQLLEPGTKTPKYEFEMELSLKETQRGRWNKLDIDTYRSINLANGEVLGLSLKHQKPFYFSKVKSYHPTL